jgi:hypothetical protein
MIGEVGTTSELDQNPRPRPSGQAKEEQFLSINCPDGQNSLGIMRGRDERESCHSNPKEKRAGGDVA